MKLNGIDVVDTFAEAFPMAGTRVLITAESHRWARTAGQTMSGYGTSVIACDAEVAIERDLQTDETPDGRPGVSVLAFAFSPEVLESALVKRVGQCVMTCPTTACYNGLMIEKSSLALGAKLRYFGDGWQTSKRLEGRRYWRIPVMDGEFVCEDRVGVTTGVAGGNVFFLGSDGRSALGAAEAAVDAIRKDVPGVALTFPGGIARSGSKVGSKYKGLLASTNTAYAPALRGVVDSLMPAEAKCCYEIVMDGLDLAAIEHATAVALRAGARPGIIQLSAGNYGGKLGPHHIRLYDVIKRYA